MAGGPLDFDPPAKPIGTSGTANEEQSNAKFNISCKIFAYALSSIPGGTIIVYEFDPNSFIENIPERQKQ